MLTGSAATSSAYGALPAVRPEGTLVGCSLHEPVCVHVPPRGAFPQATAVAALQVGERTLEFLRRQGLPHPVMDGALGGGPELDLYLASAPGGSRALGDPASVVGAFEQGSAFVLVDARARGCELESDVARGIVEATLLGLDPSAHDAALSIGASQLAAAIAPCTTVETAAVDRYQRAPELAASRASAERFAGEVLFADYLDETYGRGVPYRLWTDLVALSGQAVATSPLERGDEPDVFDTVRRSLTGLGTSLEDALLGFAIARAFAGSRSDGGHLADSARYGDLGRVRFDWSASLATLPRRLRTRVVEPTGASYVWLDVTGATEKDALTMVAECEHTHAFRWALVTVDSEGKELGRHVGGRFGEHTTQLSLDTLVGAAAVIVVGASAGHDDRNRPFDPDEGAPSEAACEVTLHRR